MMHTETNEENLTAFIKLLDSAMCHEASVVHVHSMRVELGAAFLGLFLHLCVS